MMSVVPEPLPVSPLETSRFLVALGEAMIDAGDPVTHVQRSLSRVAQVNDAPQAEVVVMATALFVSVPGSDTVHTAVATAGGRSLRLDQVEALFDLVKEAEAGRITPTHGIDTLESIRSRPPSFGAVARVLGYVVLTVGLALILRATWYDLLLSGVLGGMVGILQLGVGRYARPYRVFLPVMSSFGVALTVFLLARGSVDIGVFTPLIAPLVTFLPGALLTTAVIELSTGQMISGAGRLAAGAMQLVLLAVGIVAAAELVGVPPATVAFTAVQTLGAWTPWLGVAVFGCGVVVHFCARPSSLGWLVLVLYAAYAGQSLGGLWFGGVLAAFVGAVVMTPVAMLVSLRPSGPPTLVSFLPAFWLLVPGALGLIGVTKYLGDDRAYGAASLVTAGATMVAIALGVLLGLTTATGVFSVFHRRTALAPVTGDKADPPVSN
jgi:uncharacterized membrane protein YjjP (DUF1212 family)